MRGDPWPHTTLHNASERQQNDPQAGEPCCSGRHGGYTASPFLVPACSPPLAVRSSDATTFQASGVEDSLLPHDRKVL